MVFREGVYAQVTKEMRYGAQDSKGGAAFINSCDETSEKYTVKYVITQTFSKDVDEERLSLTTMDTAARINKENPELRPSLLSLQHQPALQKKTPPQQSSVAKSKLTTH